MTITALEYPWAERPSGAPITPQELEIALKLAEWDVKGAAKHLRTSVERVAGCLTFKSNVHLAKRVWAKTVTDFISVNDFGNQVKVIVKKPKQPSKLEAIINDEGNLEATITFENPRADEFRRMALRVLEEKPQFNQCLFEERRETERQRAVTEGAKHDRRV